MWVCESFLVVPGLCSSWKGWDHTRTVSLPAMQAIFADFEKSYYHQGFYLKHLTFNVVMVLLFGRWKKKKKGEHLDSLLFPNFRLSCCCCCCFSSKLDLVVFDVSVIPGCLKNPFPTLTYWHRRRLHISPKSPPNFTHMHTPKADLEFKPRVVFKNSEGWFWQWLNCNTVTSLQAIFFDLIRWTVVFFFLFAKKLYYVEMKYV